MHADKRRTQPFFFNGGGRPTSRRNFKRLVLHEFLSRVGWSPPYERARFEFFCRVELNMRINDDEDLLSMRINDDEDLLHMRINDDEDC